MSSAVFSLSSDSLLAGACVAAAVFAVFAPQASALRRFLRALREMLFGPAAEKQQPQFCALNAANELLATIEPQQVADKPAVDKSASAEVPLAVPRLLIVPLPLVAAQDDDSSDDSGSSAASSDAESDADDDRADSVGFDSCASSAAASPVATPRANAAIQVLSAAHIVVAPVEAPIEAEKKVALPLTFAQMVARKAPAAAPRRIIVAQNPNSAVKKMVDRFEALSTPTAAATAASAVPTASIQLQDEFSWRSQSRGSIRPGRRFSSSASNSCSTSRQASRDPSPERASSSSSFLSDAEAAMSTIDLRLSIGLKERLARVHQQRRLSSDALAASAPTSPTLASAPAASLSASTGCTSYARGPDGGKGFAARNKSSSL